MCWSYLYSLVTAGFSFNGSSSHKGDISTLQDRLVLLLCSLWIVLCRPSCSFDALGLRNVPLLEARVSQYQSWRILHLYELLAAAFGAMFSQHQGLTGVRLLEDNAFPTETVSQRKDTAAGQTQQEHRRCVLLCSRKRSSLQNRCPCKREPLQPFKETWPPYGYSTLVDSAPPLWTLFPKVTSIG